jgi:hypothetical protein
MTVLANSWMHGFVWGLAVAIAVMAPAASRMLYHARKQDAAERLR